jgi:hypothetical protein
VSDGLLDTRREKALAVGRKLGLAGAPVALLAAFVGATGGGPIAVAVALLGGLAVVMLATSVRTSRGALVGGLVTAAVLVLLLMAVHWLVTHPIE